MSDTASEFPERPAPPMSVWARASAWVEWVGAARVVVSAIVVLAVVAGAYWLVKPPPATTESKLPYANTATTLAEDMLSASPTTADTLTASPELVVVHVAGAVKLPGVYRLMAGSRVIDAVDAAGGVAADSNSDAINLAAVLADGERVYVPRVGEVAPVVAAGASVGSPLPSGPVNLNNATADDLDTLPGVGPATAEAILAYRDQHGPFSSLDDLAEVSGIGPAKIEALRGLVTV